jgi:hypothetical protein
MTAFSVDDGSEIKTWTAKLLYNDNSGKKRDRTIETSLQYYKVRAVYHSNTCIVSSPRGDLCVIAEMLMTEELCL